MKNLQKIKKQRGFLSGRVVIPVLAVALLATVALGTRGNKSDTPPTAAPKADKPVKIQRITGHINSKTQNFDLVIAAILIDKNNIDGVAQIQGSFQVAGITTFPKGLRGPVVEVVPPEEIHDYWCINTAIDNLQGLEGYNVLVYVKDIGDGKTTFDKVAFSDGFGANCIDSPTPSTPFEEVESGNFRSVL